MSCDWGQDPVVVSSGLGNSPSGCIKTGKFLLVAERLFSSLILLFDSAVCCFVSYFVQFLCSVNVGSNYSSSLLQKSFKDEM